MNNDFLEGDKKELEEYLSPTIQVLEQMREKDVRMNRETKMKMPEKSVICRKCPVGMWHTTPADLTCYCKVMMAVVWTSSLPGEIIFCDEPANIEREKLEAEKRKAEKEAEKSNR